MSTFWTLVPLDEVFRGAEAYAESLREIQVEGVTMLVSPAGDGNGKIERIISPDPQDYMRADWQPGSVIRMNPDIV